MIVIFVSGGVISSCCVFAGWCWLFGVGSGCRLVGGLGGGLCMLLIVVSVVVFVLPSLTMPWPWIRCGIVVDLLWALLQLESCLLEGFLIS